MSSRRTLAFLATVLVAFALCAASASRLARAQPSPNLTATEARALAQEAWIFGLPLVSFEAWFGLNADAAGPESAKVPLNQLLHHRSLPVAGTPHAPGTDVDTLHSSVYLDLSKESLVLEVPQLGDRYWILQLVDAWNNTPYAPGSRRLGGMLTRKFGLLGPDASGAMPFGLVEFQMPTSLAVLSLRIATTGTPEDLAAVRALQDQFRLVPAARWGEPYTPPETAGAVPGIDVATPAPARVATMPPERFFIRLNRLLVSNPPSPDDPKFLARLARLGIRPGVPFDFAAFSPDLQQAIRDGVDAARAQVREHPPGTLVDQWRTALGQGRYETRYADRAHWTLAGLGPNLQEDVVEFVTELDADGAPLDGTHRYRMDLTRAQMAVVRGGWSLTLYDKAGRLVANSLNRHSLGWRDKPVTGADGAFAIHLQGDAPGADDIANWLPTPPAGPMRLVLRLYQPAKRVLEGSWAPPAIRRVQ